MVMGNSARVELEDGRPGLVNKWKSLLQLEVKYLVSIMLGIFALAFIPTIPQI